MAYQCQDRLKSKVKKAEGSWTGRNRSLCWQSWRSVRVEHSHHLLVAHPGVGMHVCVCVCGGRGQLKEWFWKWAVVRSPLWPGLGSGVERSRRVCLWRWERGETESPVVRQAPKCSSAQDNGSRGVQWTEDPRPWPPPMMKEGQQLGHRVWAVKPGKMAAAPAPPQLCPAVSWGLLGNAKASHS